MKALMDEVRLEEGRVVVHMRKCAGQGTAKDALKNSLEQASFRLRFEIDIESIY